MSQAKFESDHEPASTITSPVRFSLQAWVSVFRRTLASVLDMDMSLRCAGVAFFGFLSIFPAMSAAVSLFGLIADPGSIRLDDIAITQALPADVVAIIQEQLNAFVAKGQTLGISLVISVAIAFWSGTRGMNALIHAITKAHMEIDNRSFMASVLMSFGFTIGAFATLGVIIFAVTILPTILLLWPFKSSAETLALLIRWPVVALIVATAVFVLYRKAPNRRDPRSRWVAPGALLASLLWLGGSFALSAYIQNFGNYDAMFGSIATAAVFMLWLYFTATVLVMGASLNAQLEWQTRADTTVGPERPEGERGAFVADTTIETARRSGEIRS